MPKKWDTSGWFLVVLCLFGAAILTFFTYASGFRNLYTNASFVIALAALGITVLRAMGTNKQIDDMNKKLDRILQQLKNKKSTGELKVKRK
jgi:Flp pilus assembly protein TadB